MQFLNPIWLFGISGILIPIIIHLWNIKSGKVLKVGSIMLMGESSRENSRSLKLQDYLLLVIRCLIIILLSLLLAEPVLKTLNDKSAKGWLLIPRADLKNAYSHFKPEIDSLLKTEYEFHLFEPGFPKAEFADYLENTEDSMVTSDLSYWSLARKLNSSSPAGTAITIFSNRLMKNFGGLRANIPKHIKWKTFVPDLKKESWISSAWLSSNDSIRVLRSYSDTSTIWHQLITLSPQGKHPDFTLSLHDGQPAVSLTAAQGETEHVVVDTSSIRIGIYSEKHPEDISYLKAALTAVRDFTGRKILVDELAERESANGLDLIFWLSEKPIPPAITEIKEVDLFAYTGGTPVDVNSQIHSLESGIFEKSDPIALFKKTSDASESSEFNIWTDGSGKPILSRNLTSGQTVYRFYSRFNPDWSELVWSAQFPELLLPIIMPNEGREPVLSKDTRTIDPRILQVSNETRSEKIPKLTSGKEFQKISIWILLVVLGLVGVERWIAHSKQNAQYGI